MNSSLGESVTLKKWVKGTKLSGIAGFCILTFLVLLYDWIEMILATFVWAEIQNAFNNTWIYHSFIEALKLFSTGLACSYHSWNYILISSIFTLTQIVLRNYFGTTWWRQDQTEVELRVVEQSAITNTGKRKTSFCDYTGYVHSIRYLSLYDLDRLGLKIY